MKAKLIKLTLHDGYRLDDENGLLIASTLESSKNKLSLKNCQAIQCGYDLDDLASQKYPIENTGTMFMPNRHEVSNVFRQEGFKAGFQKALDLMADKKFTDEDIYEAFHSGERGDRFELGELLDSHQQTQWDVIVKMEDVMTFANMPKEGENRVYELDADGCLILTKI